MHSSFWWVINFLEIMFDNYSKNRKCSEWFYLTCFRLFIRIPDEMRIQLKHFSGSGQTTEKWNHCENNEKSWIFKGLGTTTETTIFFCWSYWKKNTSGQPLNSGFSVLVAEIYLSLIVVSVFSGLATEIYHHNWNLYGAGLEKYRYHFFRWIRNANN